jgi:sec-independent protein translocase protein TatA
MGALSVWHWVIVLAVILIVFGAGRLPSVMGDLAKGIKNFKHGMKEGAEDETPVLPKDESKAV